MGNLRWAVGAHGANWIGLKASRIYAVVSSVNTNPPSIRLCKTTSHPSFLYLFFHLA